MTFLFVLGLLSSSSIVSADTIQNALSQSRVSILKVVQNFETGIIEDIRQGKIIESCMKIADAHSASIALQNLSPKTSPSLEAHLAQAKTDCVDLDLIKVDEMYLKKISGHLVLARQEFEKK